MQVSTYHLNPQEKKRAAMFLAAIVVASILLIIKDVLSTKQFLGKNFQKSKHRKSKWERKRTIEIQKKRKKKREQQNPQHLASYVKEYVTNSYSYAQATQNIHQSAQEITPATTSVTLSQMNSSKLLYTLISRHPVTSHMIPNSLMRKFTVDLP